MAAVWDGSNFSRAHACGLRNGGAASIANRKSTSPLEIYAKVSGDGITWPADGDAVLVDTYSGSCKQFHIRQKSESGHITLVVTNGIDAAWESNDNGRTWTAL